MVQIIVEEFYISRPKYVIWMVKFENDIILFMRDAGFQKMSRHTHATSSMPQLCHLLVCSVNSESAAICRTPLSICSIGETTAYNAKDVTCVCLDTWSLLAQYLIVLDHLRALVSFSCLNYIDHMWRTYIILHCYKNTSENIYNWPASLFDHQTVDPSEACKTWSHFMFISLYHKTGSVDQNW